MEISLQEFEQQIDETILKRGFDYFKKGYVTDVDELGGGEYDITIEGTETYTVNLIIRGNTVKKFECDCPYDMGPVCKHVAAALFYLQKDILETITIPVQTKEKKPKEKSIAQQAEELLNTLSHEALKTFVGNICTGDHKFRQLFVAKHAHLSSPASKELYAKQIQALIETYSDKHGFVNYSTVGHLSNAIDEIAEEANRNLYKGHVQAALFATLAIAEEMTELLNYNVDDSNGEIGGCIEGAFEILGTLTEMDLDKTQHDELFDQLVTLFENNTLKGWDWHFATISLAIKLLKTSQEKERIKTALNKIKPTNDKWDWDYQKSQELMLELIQKTENETSATQYMENNLSNSNFRAKLIETALKTKDYNKAKAMAEEGVAKDDKDAPGLADQWRDCLLTIAQKTEDTENTIRLARYFLIHSNGRHHPLKYYYDILKNLVPNNQWTDYLENLIVGIKSKNRWIDYDRISQLYIWESHWDRLLELLRQNAGFERIAAAEPYLSDSYSTELATLYKENILVYMSHNMGRSHYQTVCRYIRRMIKLKARPMATDLIEELKSLYPGRRALMEELNQM